MATTTNAPVIELHDVSRSFGGAGTRVTAVSRASLRVYPGEFVAIVGASGSGKSTLLSLIGTLDRPDEGVVRLLGQDLSRLSQAQLSEIRFRSIGLVFQQFYLLPALSALDNVVLPLLPRRTPFDKKTRALEKLQLVGMGPKQYLLPSQMSGGEQQRVCIARALVADPQIILADEPTGNLDSANGWQVFETLMKLTRAGNVTVVMATHNPQMAAQADRVLEITDGVMVEGRGGG